MYESPQVFRRYTDLSSLLDMIRRCAITLLPPDTWDDRNDRLMMKTYAECLGLKTLLALCLTSRGETYHHWKVLTEKSSGVCIKFRRHEFTETMTSAGVMVKKMKYLKLDELIEGMHAKETLPFLKRFGFGDEGEYRAVYKSEVEEVTFKSIPFDLKEIDSITLNPWMPKPVFESVRSTIQELSEGAFPVNHSTLIENRTWRDFASQYRPKANCSSNGRRSP